MIRRNQAASLIRATSSWSEIMLVDIVPYSVHFYLCSTIIFALIFVTFGLFFTSPVAGLF